MMFQFDPWLLDSERYELRQHGQLCKVEPQVFDLLEFLLRHHDRVVSKEELLEQLWGGKVVSDATLSTCVKAARQAIGDDGQAQRLIRTSHGRGFRFIGELALVEDTGLNTIIDGAAETPSEESQPGRTTLALLPFTVFADDPEMEYLADGLVEDLTTILAHASGLLVISRSSSFAYKGQHPSAQQVRQELGVDYMVEGSVRVVADQVRINVQLINTVDGGHLWARRFDSPVGEVSALQDELINAICRHLEAQLDRVSYSQVKKLDCDRDAWLLYQQASGLLATKGWNPDTFTEAIAMLRRSVEIAPGFAQAHAYLALVVALGQRVGLLQQRQAALLESLLAADTALSLDDHDSTVLGFAGCALADTGHIDRATPILEQAVELDPSNAQAWAALGSAKILDHRFEAGINDLQQGIKISPLDNRLAVWGSVLAVGMMMIGDLDRALIAVKTACRSDLKNHIPQVTLAAVLLAAEQPDAAKSALSEAYRLRPELSALEIRCLVGDRAAGAIDQLALSRS
ncbi:MAG: winged helix-turn-helix domain-containing protein [Motiliproteus sp.]